MDANGKPVNPPAGKYRQATPHEKGAAVAMYYDGLSYRRTAENVGQHFGRETNTPRSTPGLGIWRNGLTKYCGR